MFTRVDLSKLTLMDALDLASLIELEAYQRYAMFTGQLGHSYPDDAHSVFQAMAENEKKHAEQLAERRRALFGNAPAKVTQADIFDVEAPDVGAPRWDMSPLKALKVALAAEHKAFNFYDSALPSVKQLDVRALFLELREEEAEHIQMVEDIIARLPPQAANDIEDLDTE